MSKVLSEEKDAERREMWESGMTDKEIAAKLNLTETNIIRWRKVRGLDKRLAPDCDKAISRKIWDMYVDGYEDGRIAELVSRKEKNIKLWRIRRSLPMEGPALEKLIDHIAGYKKWREGKQEDTEA